MSTVLASQANGVSASSFMIGAVIVGVLALIVLRQVVSTMRPLFMLTLNATKSALANVMLAAVTGAAAVAIGFAVLHR